MVIALAIIHIAAVADNAPTRVACVGNSITYGANIANHDRDTYPAVLGQMLGKDYDVRNFGFSARTLLMKGDRPYMKEKLYKDALAFNPQIVIIKLGTNDSKPFNWKHSRDFSRDLQSMIDAFSRLDTHPKIYLCLPAKVFPPENNINDSIIVNGVIPKIKAAAQKNGLDIIDLHTLTEPLKDHFPDNIHPDTTAARIIAQEVYKAITGKEKTHTPQAFPGLKSKWNGHDRYDFTYNGREAIVVAPQKAAKGNPWIWRPAFFGAFASVDSALLEKGFHVAYYDLTHLYGSPRAVRLGNSFYQNMTSAYGLSPKVTLEGFSRGGLLAFNWAAQNADKVACIYVDAPVCDVLSWPGRDRADLWSDLLDEWQLADADMADFKGNPIDNLAPIAAAKIPLISVCGDSDKVVPYRQNMAVVRDRYMALGAPVQVIVKPGCDHHPHSLSDPEPVVDFIVSHQPGYDRHSHYTLRGNLNNSLQKFERERKGRVAFLGGSITEMKGWRDMVKAQLQRRFPYTQFEWIEAGIASTGTTPGAFRLQNDVLQHGPVDLLFVEAAVNDDTNGFDATHQVRGMEGIVRHALTENPLTDIVMLHFIYDPFIPGIAQGQLPDVIMNHERVANHYAIPSINLCREIGERMLDDEFTWEQFGGTHPSWFGHKFYAAAISRLLDDMWTPAPAQCPVPHTLPAPLDSCSYFGGKFIDVSQAKFKKGWAIDPKWRPADNVEKRNGFVDTPMLVSNTPGAKLELDFEGTDIGIFCVSGPKAACLEYSIDGGPFRTIDTSTQWSRHVYLPWVYMLGTQLPDSRHRLTLRIAKGDAGSTDECIIRNFVVNATK